MLQYPFDGAYIMANKRALKKQLLQQPGLLKKKIAIVSGSTIGEIKNILEIFLLDFGIEPEFFVGEYARYYEEIVFDPGELRAFAPDLIFVHTGLHNLQLPKAGCSAAEAEQLLQQEQQRFSGFFSAAGSFGCPVVMNNFEYPRVRVLGNLAASDPSGRVRFVREMNSFFARHAETTPGFYLNDINYLSSWYGLERWSDPSYYNSYKYAQSPEAIPLLCHSAASVIKAVFGRSKKALMLDLDNTLWGGVIGDEGVEGIALGTEAPGGIAYLDTQSYAKELTGAGIVLGVLSKNDDDVARSGFTHPSSVLKVEDFAVFTANWNDKANNLLAAARQLNIGADALVFLDDNPAEREIVRSLGAGVGVPEVDLPERFAETVDHAGYFEPVSISEDDRKRAQMYAQNAQRAAAEASFTDYGGYLDSLEMQAFIEPFLPERMERITALANKSNQFNLTTRRYTVSEMQAVAADPGHVTLSGRLVDRFGDNGLVSEIIGRVEGCQLEIELWLMSCRVLKRDLELAMFDQLVEAARAKGVQRIIGVYLKTPKNSMVAGHYQSLGFTLLEQQGEDSRWYFDIPEDYTPRNTHIKVN